MILLKTLGSLSAQVDDRRIRSNSELLLGALLFLVAQRGNPVRRQLLMGLFFPADHPSDAGRQLLYRLRHCGVDIEGEPGMLHLPKESFTWDVETLLARGHATDEELAALQRGYLSDYRPRQKTPLQGWLDDHRADVASKLRALLVRQIQELRQRKEFRSLHPVAKACLALDPLNEEATLAAAESLAAVGAKADALHVIDQYMEDVGSRSPELRIAPSLLRERISSYMHEPEREPIPLIGRSEELATVMGLIEQSAGKNARACLISGPGGIGKTRLVEEACRLASLSGHAVVKATLSQHDVDRPFAILRDLGPALLDLKGALGAAPETLAAVRGLCGRGPSQYFGRPENDIEARAVAADIQKKFLDLADAVSEEQSLVIWIEDGDRMDDASRELISALASDARSVCILVSSRRGVSLGKWLDAVPSIVRIVLQALKPMDARAFVAALFRETGKSIDGIFADNAVRIAAGVPLFIRLLYKHYLVTDDRLGLPETLAASVGARLGQLQEPLTSVFDAVVILNPQSTVDLLEEVVDIPRHSLIYSLRSLEEQGFVRFVDGSVLPSHDLLADAAHERMPSGIRSLIHRWAAEALETREGADPMAVAHHWEMSNERERAVAVLLKSADTSTSVGRPREAIALLQRARQIASTHTDQHRLDVALFEALFAAGEEHEGFLVAERLGILAGQGPPEHQVMTAELASGAGRGLRGFVSPLTRIAGDKDLPARIRGRAARLLVIIAVDEGTAPLAQRVLGLIDDLGYDSVETLLPRLIFEVSFGAPEKAAVLATRVRELAGSSDKVSLRLKALSNAVMGMWRCGDTEQARETAAEAFEVANAAGVWSECTTLASIIASMAWNAGDTPLAREWLQRSDESIKRSAGPDRAYQNSGLAISIALEERNYNLALAILEECERTYPEAAKERFALPLSAHRIRIRLAMGFVPTQEEVDSLLAGHLARRHLGFHDFVADTVFEVLLMLGRTEEAHTLRREYLTQYRKDLFPLDRDAPHLAQDPAAAHLLPIRKQPVDLRG